MMVLEKIRLTQVSGSLVPIKGRCVQMAVSPGSCSGSPVAWHAPGFILTLDVRIHMSSQERPFL